MKHLYLFILAMGLFCNTNLFAQNPLTPSEGFKTSDIIPEVTNFAALDIYDNLLYANDGNTIHCYNMETGEEVRTYDKPDDYGGITYASFINISPDGNNIWAGFTVSGNTDDRIYKINASTENWELMAHFSGNFDLEFRNSQILVSGLNSPSWSTPNGIFILDTSGADNHQKIIETGGNSSGLAVDSQGNIYYGTYIAASSTVSRWDSNAIDDAITTTTFLTPNEATKLTDLPSGAYDCEIDAEGNLLFSYNDFTGEKGIAAWNGTEGDGQNYDILATSTDWLGMVKTSGNIYNYTPQGGVYTTAWGKPIIRLYKDAPIEIVNAVGTLLAPCGEITSKDISNVAVDADDTVTFSIESYNADLFDLLSIENNQLNIQPILNSYETSNVIIKYTANNLSVYDTIIVQPVTGMESIENWTGTGNNKAALVIKWDEGNPKDSIVWGYRWDGEATGEDMILAIAEADPRFYTLATTGTSFGTAFGGFGYDLNLTDSIILIRGENERIYPNENGLFITSTDYDFDNWQNEDNQDLFQSGWLNGFWAYYLRNNTNSEWSFASVGASSRILTDGCWDGWNFTTGGWGSQTPPPMVMNPAASGDMPPMVANPIADISLPMVHEDSTVIDISDVFTDPDNNDLYITKAILSNSNTSFSNAYIQNNNLIVEYLNADAAETEIVVEATSNGQNITDTFTVKVEQIDYTQGTFVVNEDWFGHDLGSVNFIRENGEVVYRAYRRENPNEKLGVTTQFATIYGDKVFFVSKQEPRLVVADAHTLQKIAKFDEIGDADGRAFLGVNDTLGYISTSNGIYTFSMSNNTIDDKIENTDGETGNMLLANGYVFAVQQNKVMVLQNNTVISTIEDDTYAGLTRTIDGMVWVGAGQKLLKINPYTLENETINLPEDAAISAPWYAWNANSLTASHNDNAIYWGKDSGWSGCQSIYKYTVDDESSLNQPFISLSEDWVLYGAGLRLQPITNQMYVTAKKDGWGENSLTNQVQVFDTESGQLTDSISLEEYYWFPAMPMFPDANAPTTNLVSNIIVDENAPDEIIYLTEFITDLDNLDKGIVTTINAISDETLLSANISNDTLTIDFAENMSGNSTIELHINSNGKVISHTINVTINEDQAPMVANPISDVTVDENAPDYEISLENVFTDADNDDADITKAVVFNSNTNLISTNITENNLILSFTSNTNGSVEIVIEATSNNKTVTDTFNVIVNPANNIENATAETIVIYPNPSNGVFKVKTDLNKSTSIRIYTINGKLIYANENYTDDTLIDISEFSSGQYFISAKIEDKIFKQSIIIE